VNELARTSLWYSRRTYGIALRYNPELELGSSAYGLVTSTGLAVTHSLPEVKPVGRGAE